MSPAHTSVSALPATRPQTARTRRTTTNRRIVPHAKSSLAKSQYRPYHHHGEALVLVLTAGAGVLWLIWPLGWLAHLVGSFFFFILLPSTLLRNYWPGLRLHDLGWRLPESPRQPLAYGLVVTVVCFLPLIIFLSVKNPTALAAVSPNSPWLAWLIAEGIVSLLFMTQAAFFTGLILFRLTHLMHHWAAISLVAVIMTVAQIFLPGTIGYFALPLSVAFAWMAWQTKSFVPVAATQFLLSLTYDLIVKIS